MPGQAQVGTTQSDRRSDADSLGLGGLPAPGGLSEPRLKQRPVVQGRGIKVRPV